jgi:pimeloyl-ACP methyl ester carboxylesterase
MIDAASLRHLGTAALVVALAGCGPDRAPSARLVLEECRLPRLATTARCGRVEVPEDRSKPDGRKLSIFVAVLPANTLEARGDPLLILAGGPGQSATSLAPFASRLLEVRRTRDVLLVDQRGTGRSSPLDCAAFKPTDDADDALEADPVPKARACVAELAARGVDLAQYTTPAWIDDLEAVREVLGIARWNLWGGSYGTRVALEYLRLHPQRVRSAVLDGVAPPTLKISLDVWRTRERALDDLFAACHASPACARSHADVASTLERIRQSLGPSGREVSLVNPRTGARESVRLTYEGVLAGMHPLTYVPELAATLPAMLALAADGEWTPLFAAAQLMTTDIAEQMNVALHYSVTCAEDASRIDAQERSRLESLKSAPLARAALAVCDHWPRGRVPPVMFAPVASDVPVLLLSGRLDPVTPPAYAEEAARTLARHRHVIAGGYGHIVSPHACGPRLIASFVETAGFDTLSAPCIDYFERSERPPLWPDRLGPAP